MFKETNTKIIMEQIENQIKAKIPYNFKRIITKQYQKNLKNVDKIVKKCH